jgi:hypothetical protein
MVLVAFAEKGQLPPKEEVHWRVLSVVGFAVVRGGLTSAENAPHEATVVRLAADHDGAVPGCPGGAAIIEVVADHDDAVLGCPAELPLSRLRLMMMAQTLGAPVELPLSGLQLMMMASPWMPRRSCHSHRCGARRCR